MIKTCTNLNDEQCLYVNSGTWEDQKTRDKSIKINQDILKMHFVVIDPVNSNKKKLQVSLYQYNAGIHLLKESNSIDL